MEEKDSKKKINKKIVLSIILLITIAFAWVFIQYKKTHISTDDAYITNNVYWVHPKVSGVIEKVLFDNNKYVNEGDVLAIINQKPYKLKLLTAKANVALAKAKIMQAKASIDAVKSEIELVKAKYDNAQWDFERAKRLFKLKVISKDKYQDYLTNYKVIKYTLNAKKSSLNQALANLQSGQRALDAAKAALKNAKLYLSYTLIKAPESGFVSKKGVEVGKFAAPQIPICALVPNKGAWIVANYKESQINRIKKGEEVHIEIDAYPQIELKGVVDSIQYGTGEVFSLFPPQNASGNWIKVTQRIPVKILIKDKPNLPLRVGMSAKVVVLAK